MCNLLCIGTRETFKFTDFYSTLPCPGCLKLSREAPWLAFILLHPWAAPKTRWRHIYWIGQYYSQTFCNNIFQFLSSHNCIPEKYRIVAQWSPVCCSCLNWRASLQMSVCGSWLILIGSNLGLKKMSKCTTIAFCEHCPRPWKNSKSF